MKTRLKGVSIFGCHFVCLLICSYSQIFKTSIRILKKYLDLIADVNLVLYSKLNIFLFYPSNVHVYTFHEIENTNKLFSNKA